MNQSDTKIPKVFIFMTILLDSMGLGLLIPILPNLIRNFSTDLTYVSEYYGLFIGSYALMQFLASPVLGSLSDRFGRKPILLVSLLGAGVDYLFMALAPTLQLLFIGRIFSGLTGASHTVASSYIVDISSDKDRSANFGIIGAAWGVGFILGPVLGGLLESLGPKAPFLTAAGLNIINFLFGLFFLPESLPQSRRRFIRVKNLNPFNSILKVLKPSPFVTMIWMFFLLFLAGQVHPVNWTLYTQVKFGWSARQVGISLSFVGVVFAISQGLLTRVIIPKLGEKTSITFGISVNAISFAMFALATHGWMMYAIIAFFALTGMTMPALQSIVSSQVPATEQGELQGSLVALGSLSSILAPLLFTYLFTTFTNSTTVSYFPGAAYMAASWICGLTLLIWVFGKKRAFRTF